MITVIRQGVVFALLFQLLQKFGNSITNERIELFYRFYKERWQIETAYRALKTNGYIVEDSNLTAIERI